MAIEAMLGAFILYALSTNRVEAWVSRQALDILKNLVHEIKENLTVLAHSADNSPVSLKTVRDVFLKAYHLCLQKREQGHVN